MPNAKHPTRYQRCQDQNCSAGFTLIEVMVAMVVLAIGLLGMAAMTMHVMRSGRKANDLQAATDICQLKMEDLKDQDWADLGSATSGDTTARKLEIGLPNGALMQPLDTNDQVDLLNPQGRTFSEQKSWLINNRGLSSEQADTEAKLAGPYRYIRSFVICRGEDYLDNDSDGNFSDFPGGAQTLTDEPDDCLGMLAKEWPEELVCQGSDIVDQLGPISREKKIKILCSWQDRTGRCHSVFLDTTVVDI